MEKVLDKAIVPTRKFIEELLSQGECVVICYNQAEVWQSRERASEFYLEAMCACEGCERERYMDVLLDLMAGRRLCHDGVTQFITRETSYR